ncbi:MAG TPA: L-threonylcarbamoyladenylate synthase [Candidatus Coprousia avicola]|nr:L-threonylcarbamoyladenylate synthase [Candidatus Coprousia avicola]
MGHIYRIASDVELEQCAAIQAAAQVLREGGLALIPTETVYGLAVAVLPSMGEPALGDVRAERETVRVNGCPVPPASSGYRRIFAVKQRDLTQTVPWLVADADALDRYGRDIDERARVLAEAFWPGALTIIVPARENVPAYCRAADGTVALRASASPVVSALIRVLGAPLACTSANTHGAPAPASFDAVEPRVLAGVDIALDAGPTPCQDASTIVACAAEGVRIVRQGSLAADAIERALIRAGFAPSSPAEER